MTLLGLAPADAQQPKQRRDGRYYITGSGNNSSFVIIDTQTGRCWELLPHMPAEHRWRDLGAPPVEAKKNKKADEETDEAEKKIDEVQATPPTARLRLILRTIESEEQRLREAQREVAARKLELLRALEHEGLLYDKLDDTPILREAH